MFTAEVEAEQDAIGAKGAFASRYDAKQDEPLGANEVAFLTSRTSIYMASVNSAGWPYVQHRGGPPGFLKVINPTTLAMPDFRGNRQYVSVGNLAENDRASLFFMDYPRQARLKIFARVGVVQLEEKPELAARLVDETYKAKIERAFEFTLEAFDWNCPQHITPRYTEDDIRAVTGKLTQRIASLELELEKLSRK